MRATAQVLWGVCHDCKLWHPIELVPGRAVDNALNDWWTKHEGHGIEFRNEMRMGLVESAIRKGLRFFDSLRSGRRRLLTSTMADYRPNADVKAAYGSSAAFTLTLASLASDTSLVAGRQSTPIDNTSNLYSDYLLTNTKVTTGTSPTAARQIEMWVFASMDDSPTYPDTFSTGDANRSLTTADIKAASCAPWIIIPTDNTSNRGYPTRPTSLASLHGNSCPKRFGIWCVHNTAVVLNATGGNHVQSYYGIFQTVI